jgi:ubiquinone/menaquinone biosynthesis C-methylase UbiE
MGFSVPPDAYDRFMGRYSSRLAPRLADLAAISAGQRVIDVGCGPGALTAELAERVGQPSVAAVDPSEPFVDAACERHPGVDVRLGPAEQLPFPDRSFDAALAQLVVNFMSDPVAGVAEMRRVTRAGGVVAACVWDHTGGRGPLSPLWEAAAQLDPTVEGESRLVGSTEGDLERVFSEAGLAEVEEKELSVSLEHPSFEEWWEPFTFGVGPAGAYVAGLGPSLRDELRERCRALLPPEPFTLTVSAWGARGVA